MHIILKSSPLPHCKMSPKSHNIYLFYFLDEHKNHTSGTTTALERNLQNSLITKIFIFSNRDKGKQIILSSEKVEYIYSSTFYFSLIQDFVEERCLQGYLLVGTPYVFFNENLLRLKDTKLHEEQCILNINSAVTQSDGSLRYSARANVIIFYSSMNVPKERRKIFKMDMTVIDSYARILYLFYILGFELYNESMKFQSFQLKSAKSFYFKEYWEQIWITRDARNIHRQTPFIIMEPNIKKIIAPNICNAIQNGNRYDIRKDTETLFNYVREKLEKKEHFVIPRIAGVENELVARIFISQHPHHPLAVKRRLQREFMHYFSKGAICNTMKNNAGILITSMQSLQKYAIQYDKVFQQCDIYTNWAPWGAVYQGIRLSAEFFQQKYQKSTLWAFVYDLYHTIYTRPWTHALRGKRVLIISSFVESYKKKVDDGVLDKIYGIDLFPECELLFLKPPQTQGSNPSEEFDVELERFAKQIEGIKDQFDVALCSCGGYGNLVCGKIFEMGKSAIYVGGVLQMYFGVLGQRWLRERSDVVRLFLNEHWSRPQDSEKPQNYQQVEGSCYW